MTFSDDLNRLHACCDAVSWVGARDLETAWAECERGDWMLWLAGRVSIDRKVLVRAAVECARPALKYVPKGEKRPAKALSVALAWTRGRATIEDVRVADASAYAYAYASASADASAYASAYAYAYAAASTADADADAAYAADAASAYARKESLRVSANTVRRLIPAKLLAAAIQEAG